ncbi:hypothetical protein TrRE_jg5452 [Triparma retinervis]|uniref:Phosphoglycerate mutase-like protein n=1 Tax=Triparma retinervis TaxID=2557542 RepID=A0A9W7F9R5_9STRA|nr:hypothetical protein TrRE_jg5452 [Triparma retinervis]
MARIKVLVMRHGERADEADEAVSDTLDPMLTSLGIQQATSAWSRLLLQTASPPSIFTSSLTRCLQTAKSIPPTPYPSLSITIAPGLASCALAVSQLGGMLPSLVPPRICPTSALNRASLLPPLSSPCKFVLPPDESLNDLEGITPMGQFRATVVGCVKSAEEGEDVVLVTHREGIRDMMMITGAAEGRVRTPYCGVAVWTVDRGTVEDFKTWDFEEMVV